MVRTVSLISTMVTIYNLHYAQKIVSILTEFSFNYVMSFRWNTYSTQEFKIDTEISTNYHIFLSIPIIIPLLFTLPVLVSLHFEVLFYVEW